MPTCGTISQPRHSTITRYELARTCTRADDRALGFLLAGQIATFVLHQQGYPCLHASAVLTDEGALAFLGPKGQGKSTIAAGFLRRGAALLADDIVSLQHDSEGIAVRPSLPIMKLWPQSVEGALALAEDLPDLVAGYEKKLLTVGGRYYLAGSPAPLRAIYVLDRYDPLAAGCTAVKIDRLRWVTLRCASICRQPNWPASCRSISAR
jgi:hypothetical protein